MAGAFAQITDQSYLPSIGTTPATPTGAAQSKTRKVTGHARYASTRVEV
jgi:hypothetical protein